MSQKTQRSLSAKCRRAPSISSRRSPDDRQRDQLTVGMLERRPGRRAVVLEDQDVLQAEVALQIEHPLAPRPQHALDLGLGQQRHPPIVIRRLDDHLVRADAAQAIEHALAFAIERPSTCSAGYLFGTTRTSQPGVFGALP
jgi:hypothetical protein